MDSLRDALLDIRQRRGLLTAQVVVEESRSNAAPLHHHFEWDDAVAGEKYRVEQAREIIRSVKIKYADVDGVPSETRGFVSVARGNLPAREYLPIEDVRNDPELVAAALRDAEREWRSLYVRYRNLQGFLTLVRETVDA
jgi:hypothetical protein